MSVLLATVLTLALSTGPAAAAPNQLPRTAAEAMTLDEGDPDRWLDGPANYLILEEELAEWNTLETSEQRAAFITRFWDRRDADLGAPGNPFKDGFYERVAHANRRYRDTRLRGWKSDRGRIAVTLGLPDGERAMGGGSGLIWTYRTFGAHAEGKGVDIVTGRVEIAFLSRDAGRHNYTISGSQGSGFYPQHVRDALDISRRAAVGESSGRP